MYRLDYLNAGPVTDFTNRDYLCKHMATARNVASERAQLMSRQVLITRIGKAGSLKPTLVANPDGTFSRPPGSEPVSEREDCKAGNAEGLACFCTPCRAARRLI